MLPQTIIAPEHTTALPVDTFRNLAVDHLIQTHQQLDALPKNPFKDDTPDLLGITHDLGVTLNTPEILSEIMQHLALGGLADAFNMGAAAHTTMDVGTSYMTARADNDNGAKQTFKREAKPAAASASTTAVKRAPAAKPLLGATRIVQNAMQEQKMKAYKQTLKKRRALEAKLYDLVAKIEELNTFKSCGIQDVVMTADGKELRGLAGKKFVHAADRQRFEQRTAMELKYGHPFARRAMAAPAPRMGMGMAA